MEQTLSNSTPAFPRDAVFVSLIRCWVQVAQAADTASARRGHRRLLAEVIDSRLLQSGTWLPGWLRSRDKSEELLRTLRIFLHVVEAREEGRLPAWEGIRVVREPRGG